MLIRGLASDDIGEVYTIECESFSSPWTKAALLGELESEKSHYLVAVEEMRIVGYIGFWKIFDEGHVTNVAVSSAWRSKGVGSALVEAMKSYGYGLGINSYTLEVRVGNRPAIALYEKHGFESAGIRKNFYDHPNEDAMIMWCHGKV